MFHIKRTNFYAGISETEILSHNPNHTKLIASPNDKDRNAGGISVFNHLSAKFYTQRR